jgi:hypothetical protein
MSPLTRHGDAPVIAAHSRDHPGHASGSRQLSAPERVRERRSTTMPRKTYVNVLT